MNRRIIYAEIKEQQNDLVCYYAVDVESNISYPVFCETAHCSDQCKNSMLSDSTVEMELYTRIINDNEITFAQFIPNKEFSRDDVIKYVRWAMQYKGYTPEYEVREFINNHNL